MKIDEYARMAQNEKEYWWHIGRLKIIETELRRFCGNRTDLRILNVGCGTGGTIATLEKFGTVDNVDVSDQAIKFMKKNAKRKVTKVTGIKLPFKSGAYDLVVAFDVLEHIKNDIGALKEWKRVLNKQGAVILTVPAYQWLWSEHDVSLEHYRRYTTKTIRNRAVDSGLHVMRASYAILFSMPLVIGFRWIHKIRRTTIDAESSYVDVPKWVNTLFSRLLFIEAWLHRYMRFYTGTSVIATLTRTKK